ncbi:hypothetical protein COLO4_32803 [Corchorus olitorius]|uniref:Uncharacterized protein n=1 Tax=Corchorus olitorius TaxID=93759 RepID=A0A1R3GY46_9ROSI|nr:hypothetical protein COLO4_32803 [Corchorus olitorius]
MDSSDSENEITSIEARQSQLQAIHDRRILRIPFQRTELEPYRAHWRRSLYKRVYKLYTTCGIIGHKRGYCPYQCAEVEDMINQQIREAITRVDCPSVTVPTLNQFVAEMKAYSRRRSIRNATFYYFRDWDDNAETSQQGGAQRGNGGVQEKPPPNTYQQNHPDEPNQTTPETPNLNTNLIQIPVTSDNTLITLTTNTPSELNLASQNGTIDINLNTIPIPEPLNNLIYDINPSDLMVNSPIPNTVPDPNLIIQNIEPALNPNDPLFLDPHDQIITLNNLEPSPDVFIPDSSILKSPLNMELVPIVDLDTLETNPIEDGNEITQNHSTIVEALANLGNEVEPPNLCQTNEEDFSALFLNDEHVEPPANEMEGEKVSTRESSKRKRNESVDESQDSEEGRQIRRKLQLLDVNDVETQTERVWLAGQNQTPQGPSS